MIICSVETCQVKELSIQQCKENTNSLLLRKCKKINKLPKKENSLRLWKVH